MRDRRSATSTSTCARARARAALAAECANPSGSGGSGGGGGGGSLDDDASEVIAETLARALAADRGACAREAATRLLTLWRAAARDPRDALARAAAARSLRLDGADAAALAPALAAAWWRDGGASAARVEGAAASAAVDAAIDSWAARARAADAEAAQIASAIEARVSSSQAVTHLKRSTLCEAPCALGGGVGVTSVYEAQPTPLRRTHTKPRRRRKEPGALYRVLCISDWVRVSEMTRRIRIGAFSRRA